MKIITTITTKMERTDGSVTELRQTVVASPGGNPRFDVHEVAKTITEASMKVLDGVAAGRTDQLP